jgi:hypothetical protein
MATDWAARIASAKADLETAKAAISEEDRAEIEARDELSKTLEARQAEERTKRDLELSRRLDAAKEILGENTPLITVSPKGYTDTFIVRRDGQAHAKWKKAIQEKSSGNKKIDSEEEERKYAASAIYDWNGITDFGITSTRGYELLKFLEKNAGVVTPIVDAAAELNGVFAEKRKS